jgi:agmatine deiminase
MRPTIALSRQAVFIGALLVSLTATAMGQRLPHGLTEVERAAYPRYVPPISRPIDAQPPTSPVRAMAEWEEVQAVQISWAFYPTVPYELVRYAQEECPVVIVCLDSVEVGDALTAAGVPLTNVRFVIADYNSEWCRDYGPISVYSRDADSLHFVDWIYNRPRPLDDSLSVTLANWFGVPLHQTTEDPYRLIGAGGNFMTDGHGTGFSSKLILEENPDKTEADIDSIMAVFLGIRRYITMNDLMYDEIHHIDMHMKLLDEETLLVGEYPEGQGDGPWIEENLEALTSSTLSCFGRPYRIIRIPMPPDVDGAFPPESFYYTYTNSVILNRSVLVPVYGLPQDSAALAVYRNAMPGYRIVGIPSNELIPGGGAIHCITREIGASEPVWISHPPVYRRNGNDTSMAVLALARSRSGIKQAFCYWTADTSRGFQEVAMTALGDSFAAVLSPLPRGKTIFYYIEARSVSGRSVTRPITAPRGYYTVVAEDLTPVADFSSPPGSPALSQNYPNPFNPVTTISYSIPTTSSVRLSVYDMLGREVSLLVDGRKSAGSYEATFDASACASGVYVYRLVAGSSVLTRKMILVR